MLGLGLSIPQLATRGGRTLTLSQQVAALFANGEQGVWYDPSDFSTLFQDAAGTIPVTAVEQPVGKMLDKSGRGNHATQATVTKRPILKIDGNGKYYLKFDGVDDALQTDSVNFTGTDKVTVWAGVRKLSDEASGIVAELSSNVGGNNQSFALFAPGSNGANHLRWVPSTGCDINSPNQYPAPISTVLACVGKKAVIGEFRVNGVSVGAGFVKTAGNYGNYPLYIGSRAGTNLPFNGHLYSLIIRGAQSSEAQILSAETYCNQKTGAY